MRRSEKQIYVDDLLGGNQESPDAHKLRRRLHKRFQNEHCAARQRWETATVRRGLPFDAQNSHATARAIERKPVCRRSALVFKSWTAPRREHSDTPKPIKRAPIDCLPQRERTLANTGVRRRLCVCVCVRRRNALARFGKEPAHTRTGALFANPPSNAALLLPK